MGLDMYLRAEKYVAGHSFNDEDTQGLYKTLVEDSGLTSVASPESPSLTISVVAAYWRKANQIHGWFVRNVQDGEDECRPHEVSREQIVELRDLCADLLKVKADDELAADACASEALPPQEGFFFGSYDIDDWYWEDLEQTVTQLDRVLAGVPAKPERLEDLITLEYQSSW